MGLGMILLIFFSAYFLLSRFNWSSATMTASTDGEGTYLFDFRKVNDLNNWIEVSDTVREVGKSKSVFELQKTKIFQRAIFFTLLNPQDNGAGFAGSEIYTKFDLSKNSKIIIQGRTQGANSGYKIVLHHNGLNNEPHPTYEQIFEAKPSDTFSLYELPLDQFKPFYRGRFQPDAPPLNKANITRFGIQVFGGVYLDYKQKGVSSFEIDFIKAV